MRCRNPCILHLRQQKRLQIVTLLPLCKRKKPGGTWVPPGLGHGVAPPLGTLVGLGCRHQAAREHSVLGFPGYTPGKHAAQGIWGDNFESFSAPGGEIKSNLVFSGDMRLGKHSAQGEWGDNSAGIESYSPCIPSQKSLDFCESVRNGWLPYDSGHKQAAYAVLGLYPSLRSIQPAHDGSVASSLSRLACSQRLASLRFGTGMAGCARLMPIPHFGPSSLLTTAQRFVLNR